MIQGLTRERHWFTDYSYVPMVWAAPDLAGFSRNRTAATVCRIFSATVLGYSLLTNARWGVIKVIPYEVHAALDLSLGVAALTVPALVREVRRNKNARTTFYLMGMTGVVVGILSLIGARRSEM